VITGYGCLTAVGSDAATTWQAVLSGRSGIRPISNWDSSEWNHRLAGEIQDYRPRELVSDRKLLKVITRQDVLGLNAVDQALQHSGLLLFRESLDDPTMFNDRTGVFVGSPATKYRHQHDYLPVLASSGDDTREFGLGAMDEVHPMWLLRALPNNVLAYTGISHGFKGANANVIAHGVSGAQAIAEACRYLRDGAVDRAVVVGYDSACGLEAIPYYASVGLLDPDGLRPFDEGRNGTVLAEGAGSLILETREAAVERGATVYAELRGSSVVSEAQGVLEIRDDGDGLERAVRLALESAGADPSEIGMISAHGNGSKVSDASEARAYVEVFGPSALPVTGFKWSLGHTIAASGVIESIMALLSLREGRVPGIQTLGSLSPECQDLSVSASEQVPNSGLGLVVSRGFAGLNSCIVISTDE
jgi:3-oxoacyl-[acyl-carrier-protein] synthase-1